MQRISEIINEIHIKSITFQESSNNNDFSIKLPIPFTIDSLKDALSRCNSTATIDGNLIHPKNSLLDKLIGQSDAIKQIRKMIEQVADSDSTVLILGQSGTGKEVIASCIHNLSKRHTHPLVPINCGAIPSELMESELFGHEKGAFTGAVSRRPGRFEIANNGTLFLDEIGDMPMNMQVKLLRVIQDRTIDRVGGNAAIKVDVRLIAATNKNLQELIQNDRFREDLYYRLNVFPIIVPKLADRKDDIPLLIEYHLQKIYQRLNYRVHFSDEAINSLCQYNWPGNIRELENFIERMVILHRDEVIGIDNLDMHFISTCKTTRIIFPEITHEPFDMGDYLAGAEQQLIELALQKSNSIIKLAAEYLSLGKFALIEKMKKYNLVESHSDESIKI